MYRLGIGDGAIVLCLLLLKEPDFIWEATPSPRVALR